MKPGHFSGAFLARDSRTAWVPRPCPRYKTPRASIGKTYLVWDLRNSWRISQRATAGLSTPFGRKRPTSAQDDSTNRMQTLETGHQERRPGGTVTGARTLTRTLRG